MREHEAAEVAEHGTRGQGGADVPPERDGAPAKGGDGGRLFGAVTTKEIAAALKEQYGMEVDSKKLVLDEPIKSFGAYQVKAKLGYEINGTVYVMVTEAK